MGQEGEDTVPDDSGALGTLRCVRRTNVPCCCTQLVAAYCQHRLPAERVVPRHDMHAATAAAAVAGDLKLRLPLRLGVGTVKAAAWQVGSQSVWG